MSDQPIRVAFCPLLYLHNGGVLGPRGQPIQQTDEEYIRGYCDEAFDCGECPILSNWIADRVSEGYQVGWECVYCLKAVPGWAPGYFQSSKNRGPPGDWVLVDPYKSLDSCTRCGHGNSFLQLVLRKP